MSKLHQIYDFTYAKVIGSNRKHFCHQHNHQKENQMLFVQLKKSLRNLDDITKHPKNSNSWKFLTEKTNNYEEIIVIRLIENW